MTPSFSRGSKGKLYRYYVSASLQQGGASSNDNTVQRVAATEIEALIDEILARLLKGTSDHHSELKAVHLHGDHILFDLPGALAATIAPRLNDNERIALSSSDVTRVEVAIALPLRGGQRLIVPSSNRKPNPDPTLIEALRKAHRMTRRERGAPMVEKGPISPYDRKILRLAFLAPELQRDIIKGLQPASLNLQKLQSMDIPLGWKEQREALGWARTEHI